MSSRSDRVAGVSAAPHTVHAAYALDALLADHADAEVAALLNAQGPAGHRGFLLTL